MVYTRKIGIVTRHHQILRAQYVTPRCRPSASKSIGRHLYGNEDWEWVRAATKSCGRDVRLPTADDHQYCSTPTKERLCLIGASPVAKQVERHHFLCLLFAARNSPSFGHSTFFDSQPQGELSTNTNIFL